MPSHSHTFCVIYLIPSGTPGSNELEVPSPLANTRRYTLPLLLIPVLLLAVASILGSCRLADRQDTANPSAVAPTASDIPPEFAKIFEVWSTLKRDHFSGDSLDAETLSVGAIKGMLSAMDDPYASYLTSQQYSTESQDFEGFFM